MYGEKAEEVEELRLDIQDVKSMYRQQVLLSPVSVRRGSACVVLERMCGSIEQIKVHGSIEQIKVHSSHCLLCLSQIEELIAGSR